jgi:acyl-CoA thioesterase
MDYEQMMVEGAPLPFQLPEWIATAPFEEHLGMRIEAAAKGEAILTMPFKVKLAQGAGLMHGGAITALADTAVAMAIKSLLPEGTHFVTTDISLKFHAPVRSGIVRAVARVTADEGKTLAGEAEVFTEDGVKAATFKSVFRAKK